MSHQNSSAYSSVPNSKEKKSVLIQNKLCTDFAGLSFPAAIATAVFWAAQIL